MKTPAIRCHLFTLLAALALSAGKLAANLAVPYHAQEMDQWCWAGCSQMALEYFGTASTQTDIAAYGSEGQNHWNWLSGSTPGTTTQPALNGIDLILRHFANISSTTYGRALTTAELNTEINALRPVIIRLGWSIGGVPKGGHFVVLRGFDGTVVDIADPWPDNGPMLKTYTALVSGPAGTYSPAADHSWTHSLTLAASVDLLFLIDSTGSMDDDIFDVRINANTILDNINSRFADSRVAVMEYRDYPEPPWGDFGDFVTRVRTGFTTNKTAAHNAINGIRAAGGNDWPEAVYSALYTALDGSSAGGWRPNPTKRMIILMGDAPGHTPEPWTGGKSLEDVLAKATDENFAITINALIIGRDELATRTFESVAGGSGGGAWQADNADQVAAAINEIVRDASESERYPRGSVASFRPRFAFSKVGDGMAAPPKYHLIELARSNSVTGVWRKYSRPKITGDSTWTPKTPLPTGHYRWRLGFKTPGTKMFSPSGELLEKVRASVQYESEFVEFDRLPVLPGEADPIRPATYFRATNSVVAYEWVAGLNASSYRVTIFANDLVWKRITVKPPKANPTAAMLTLNVKGHKLGTYYYWGIESFNYDYPKP